MNQILILLKPRPWHFHCFTESREQPATLASQLHVFLKESQMSSSRDKSQGISFVYTNLYTLYKNVKPETKTGIERIDSSMIKQAQAQNSGALALKLIQAPSAGLVEFRANIGKLQTLHSKLHIMIKELEELVGVKK